MNILIKVVVLGLCLSRACCWRLRVGPTTEAVTETDATTLVAEKTDIDQEEIDDAMILDVGRYTTQVFQYNNDQFLKGDNEFYNDTCIDEYMRCILSQTAHMPVCSFNNPWNRAKGYYTRNSYCDVYFDNCRRGYRVWRIIDYGKCKFYYNGRADDVFHTFRRWSRNPLIIQLLKVLTTQGTPAVHASTERWLEPTKEQWQNNPGDITQDRLRNYLNARRSNNNQLITNILQILATQPGNTEIYVSKFDSPHKELPNDSNEWKKIVITEAGKNLREEKFLAPK